MTSLRDPKLVERILEGIEGMAEGFAVYDARFNLLFANAAARKHIGSTFDAMERGEDFMQRTRAAIERALPLLVDTGLPLLPIEFMCQMLRAGEGVPLLADDGKMLAIKLHTVSDGFVSLSTDIAVLLDGQRELQKAKLKAEAASEAKSSFLANISHEIRTPLNGMLGMAQILLASKLEPTQASHASTIVESGNTLISLLNDVLDLSKIEAGRIEIAPTDCDVSHIFDRLTRLWEPVAEDKGLEFSVDLSSSLPRWLHFDAVRVKQCVSNLLSNAIKFTTAGEVRVHASMPKSGPNAGLVQVKVIDTGLGIDDHTMARLFTPFTQADASTGRRFGGTGLGLSISRHLARLMGGDVMASSRPDEGSVFTLTFKAGSAEAREPRPTEAAVVAESASGLKVLIVDDVLINRKVARLFLEHYGCTTAETASGLGTLELLDAGSFDIILLDIQMPGMDGIETFKRIRASGKLWAEVPVIALTANAMSGDRETYLALGMDGYLSKPIDQRLLIAELARVRNWRKSVRAA